MVVVRGAWVLVLARAGAEERVVVDAGRGRVGRCVVGAVILMGAAPGGQCRRGGWGCTVCCGGSGGPHAAQPVGCRRRRHWSWGASSRMSCSGQGNCVENVRLSVARRI